MSKLRETLGPPASSDKSSIRNLGLTFLSAFTLDAHAKSLVFISFCPIESRSELETLLPAFIPLALDYWNSL